MIPHGSDPSFRVVQESPKKLVCQLLQNIKNLIGLGEEKKAAVYQKNDSDEVDEVSEEFINGKLDRIKAENKLLEEKNNELHLEIEALKKAGQLENLSDEAFAEDMRNLDAELREATDMSNPKQAD